jgi:NADH-quinone oxidoreductase subunit L
VYALRLHLLAFGRDRTHATAVPETAGPQRLEVAAIVLLAVASTALGMLWLPGARDAVERLVGSPIEAGHAWELALAVVLVVVGAAIAVWAVRRNGDLLPHRLAGAAAGWFGATAAARRLVVSPVLASAAAAARFDDAVLDLPPRLVGRAAGGLTSVLPRFDDRVVDGAVRTVVAAARAASRGVSRTLELGVDGIVAAIADATTWIGDVSRRGDDRGVDGTVEAVADAIGIAGTQARRLQTGLAHHYYVIAVVGLVVLLGALLLT